MRPPAFIKLIVPRIRSDFYRKFAKYKFMFDRTKSVHHVRALLFYKKRGMIFINEYAYIRVSSKDQQESRQVIAMENRSIPSERIFLEKLSGKNTKRPMLQSLMDTVQKGDTVVVESISRFARNTRDLLGLVEKLTIKGVEFIRVCRQ